MPYTPHALRFRETTSQPCWLVALVPVGLVLLASGSADAQDDWASDWSGGASAVCEPACRSGFDCQRGECVPACEPPCEAGYLCTAGGRCVRSEASQGEAPPVDRRSRAGQCLPSCRRGFVCIGGTCVSACNPPCPAGQSCTEQGECVVMPDPAQEARGETEAPRSPSADSVVNLHFDVLGLLQFGLTPTLEVGERVSGYLRVRPLNTGLASYLLLPGDDEDAFDWGIGGALGLHVFSAGDGNMRGLFGGAALEYVFVRTEDEELDLASYDTHALVPQLDLGYRWALGSFLIGLGGRLGLAVPIEASHEALAIGACTRPGACSDDRDLVFLANVFLDLGVFL